MKRILVIRGGAIGDFVLTLPAIKLLRDCFPAAHLEILGYKHIAALVEKRFYADAVRSIDAPSLATCFARNAELPAELDDYFSGFDLILSYLYDPDKIFETNRKEGRRRNFRCRAFQARQQRTSGFSVGSSASRPSAFRWRTRPRNSSPRNSIGMRSGTSWRMDPEERSRFIQAAAARRRIGRSRIGGSSATRFSRKDSVFWLSPAKQTGIGRDR